MAIGIWFGNDVRLILDTAEQQAQRDKTGDKQIGALEVIDDLRRLFGLKESTATYVVRGREWLSTSEGPR